jgi:hypothetical protein
MDTLKILLAATVALLVGALAVALNKGGAGKDGEKSEYAEIKLEIEKLRMERENLEAQRKLEELRSASVKAAATPSPAAAPSINEQAALEKIAQLEAEKAAADTAAAKAERKAETYSEEAAFVGGQVLERRDNELRRARLIKDAMRMATVAEWVEEGEFGGFATVQILERDNVQVGTVLSVRRNTGILGKIKIESISMEGVIANPVTAFPGPKPQAGDDLIIDPME